MNGELFISIYLDEDVHLVIAELTTARGFRTVTARGAGQLGKADAEQLAYAADRGLCLVTHNRGDFQELHRQYATEGLAHAGIIIAVRRRPYETANRLLQLLNTITVDEIRNQMLYI